MKATNQQIKEILGHLTSGIKTIRKSGDRQMMSEAVLRIRQLRGILETRAA